MEVLIRKAVPGGIALVLLALAGEAQAQNARGFYVGAGAGRATFETQQITASLPPQTLKVKGSSTSVRVFGGYRAARWVFIEVGAVHFGEINERVGESSTDIQAYDASYGGYDVSLIGNAPLAAGAFDLFGKIGVARSTYDSYLYDSVDPTFGQDNRKKVTQSSTLYGFGGQFNFGSNKNMGIRAEYNIYDVNLLAESQTNILGSFVYRF